MNEIDKEVLPDVSGGYTPRPDQIPCTDPPTFPGFPELPGLPGPLPGDTPPIIPPAPLF